MGFEFGGEMGVALLIVGIIFAVLIVGGLIADYVLPRLKFVDRFIDQLPGYADDAEIEATYEQMRQEQICKLCRELRKKEGA